MQPPNYQSHLPLASLATQWMCVEMIHNSGKLYHLIYSDMCAIMCLYLCLDGFIFFLSWRHLFISSCMSFNDTMYRSQWNYSALTQILTALSMLMLINWGHWFCPEMHVFHIQHVNLATYYWITLIDFMVEWASNNYSIVGYLGKSTGFEEAGYILL